jgi:hypothetical protein
MGYRLEYSKQAKKDSQLLEQAGLDGKAKKLLSIVKRNPFEPPCDISASCLPISATRPLSITMIFSAAAVKSPLALPPKPIEIFSLTDISNNLQRTIYQSLPHQK